MLSIYVEDIIESPNEEINDIIDKVVKTFKNNNIDIDYINYTNKTIYVLTDEDLRYANDILRTEWIDARRLGVRASMNYRQTKNIDIIDPIRADFE